MLSRVAERVYWSLRYLERVENTARLILVRHQSILDMPRNIAPGWEQLLDVLSASASFALAPGAANEKNIVNYVFSDRNNPSSLISSLASARENMRTTREVLPSESWERVNSLYLSISRRSSKGLPRASRHSALNAIIQSCQQISGMLSGTMNHDEVYHFVRLGRLLERADMSTRIIDVGSADLRSAGEDALPYQNVLWMNILLSLSAYQMYRLCVGANVKSADVQHFLLRNTNFPRSVAYCLQEIESCVQSLPHHSRALKVVKALQRKLKRTDCRELSGDELHGLLDQLQVKLDTVHNVVATAWFSPEQ